MSTSAQKPIRLTGHINRLNRLGKFGFIRSDGDGRDFFFHFKGTHISREADMREGTVVEFSYIDNSERRLTEPTKLDIAIDVTLLRPVMATN